MKTKNCLFFRSICRAGFFVVLSFPLAAEAVQRTFVSVSGSDANVASNCSASSPCRGFSAALGVTDSGGEIIVQTSGGYGPVTIGKSVSIVAPEGIYAGISVFSGNGVTISAAGVNVILKGLTIIGLGGSYGIEMSGGSQLLVEKCAFASFSSAGLDVSTAAKVRVIDSLFRNNYRGMDLSGGASVYIGDTLVTDSSYNGIRAYATGDSLRFQAERLSVQNSASSGLDISSSSGGTTVASIKDSTFSGNGNGVYSAASTSTTRVSVSQSDFVANTDGIWSEGAGSVVVLSRNTVTRNSYGLGVGTGGVIKSAGDNAVEENTSGDVFGSTTSFVLK